MRERPRRPVALVGLVLALTACADSRTEEVADRGRSVMPFDLERTTHTFRSTADGGVQTVTSDDGDEPTITAIRTHLRDEAAAFAAGDFTDPLTVHGPDMPGVDRLVAGADRLEVDYREHDRGAELVFASTDADLVDAVHDWFDAQLSDHGDHATSG